MIYVIAQFTLLIALAWPVDHLHFSLSGALLLLVGFIVALLALYSNRPGNFNVRPVTKSNGVLITDGIYYYIRHPMYSSLFCIGLGILCSQFVWWKLLSWCSLVMVLYFKSRLEEKSLKLHYASYQQYQNTNKRFIPFIW